MIPRRSLLPLALAGLAGCGAGNAFTTHTPDAGSPLRTGSVAGYGVPAAPVALAAASAGAEAHSSVQPATFQETEPSVDAEPAAPTLKSPERPSDGPTADKAVPAPAPLPTNDTVDGLLVEPSGLTLAEVEAAAVANNPTVRGAAAAVEKARGIYTQVGLGPNPTVGVAADDIGEDGCRRSIRGLRLADVRHGRQTQAQQGR